MESAFCCIVSNGRVYQVMALVFSLHKVLGNGFHIFILCVEDEAYQLLQKIFKEMKWDNIIIVHENEQQKEDILSLKTQRKLHEYCWTLKPFFIEDVMIKHPTVKRVTYMDADLFFWADPGVIFQNQPDCSVLLCREEKSSPSWTRVLIRKMEKVTGKYNTGFISFRQDETGLACLHWWQERCLECCKIAPKDGVFGDQKYCDQMPSLFPDICEISTSGVNIGPWNYLKYEFTKREGNIFVDETRLIFFHFSSFRIRNENEVELLNKPNPETIPCVYEIYEQVIKLVIDVVKKIEPDFNGFAVKEDLKRYW